MAEQEEDAHCSALVLEGSRLVGLKKNIDQVDSANLEKFKKLSVNDSRGFVSLHFLCGDSGSGKTRFALHASAPQKRRRVFVCNTTALTADRKAVHEAVKAHHKDIDLDRKSDVMAMINYGEKAEEPKSATKKGDSTFTLSSVVSDSNEEIETQANQSANAQSDQPVGGQSSETSSVERDKKEKEFENEVQDLLTPGGLNVERFFHTLVPLLCNCIFHARAREQVLPFSKILEQFRWTGTEAPTALSDAEQQVWNALDKAALKMESVQQWKPNVKYPLLPSKPKTDQDGWEEILKNEQDKTLLAFCGTTKENEKAIHVFSNSNDASYADLIVVCEDVLLLVSSKIKVNFGANKKEVLDATASLGFSFDIDGKPYTGLEDHQYRITGTEDLARHFGCSKVVPVFALFREPLPVLMANLPEVNMNAKKDDPNARLTMKPIVLFVKPQIEHVIPSKEENEKPSDTQAWFDRNE